MTKELDKIMESINQNIKNNTLKLTYDFILTCVKLGKEEWSKNKEIYSHLPEMEGCPSNEIQSIVLNIAFGMILEKEFTMAFIIAMVITRRIPDFEEVIEINKITSFEKWIKTEGGQKFMKDMGVNAFCLFK